MWGPKDVIESRKEWEEIAKQNEVNIPEEQRIGYELTNSVREKVTRNEIIDETLRNWLNSKITIARTILAIGVAMTVLLKGQIIIWIVMYIIYRIHIKELKQKASEKNIKDYGGF